MDGEISIRAHYERFPATIKGAFVLRGEGRDPRQVRIEDARDEAVSDHLEHAWLADVGRNGIVLQPRHLQIDPKSIGGGDIAGDPHPAGRADLAAYGEQAGPGEEEHG